MQIQGRLSKLKTVGVSALSSNTQSIEYTLSLGDHQLFLNELLGQKIHISSQGAIYCLYCNRKTPKSYQQGYCFPCARKLARCDLCILKPHTCHYAQGTCREPTWGEAHCMVEHIVYLSNASGLKVGLTRGPNPVTRWADQGAIQGLLLFKTPTRHIAGQVEMQIAAHMSDKTNWRVMLKGKPPLLDLPTIWADILSSSPELKGLNFPPLEKGGGVDFITLEYPVLEYPTRLQSLSLDTEPEISGKLLGIKGQYLILSTGVLNIRKFSGYEIMWEIL
jgi:Protein of unknown function (DUF2797)